MLIRYSPYSGFIPRGQRTQRARGGTSLGFSVQPVDFQKLPKFSVASTSPAEAFKENWRSLVSLAFWLIAPFAVAYFRFLKYDVR
jgi:ABC-type transport system involved in multi-copper enzyme maturation permease subunit